MRRKLLAVVISMAAGIVLFRISNITAVCGIAAAVFLYFKIIRKEEYGKWLFSDGNTDQKAAAAMVVAMVLGAAAFCGQEALFQAFERLDTGQPVKIEAAPYKVYQVDEEKYRLECRVIMVDGKKPGSLWLRMAGRAWGGDRLMLTYIGELEEPASLTGCDITFRSPISKPDSASNPRCFDYANYLKSKKITHTAVCRGFIKVERPGFGYREFSRKVMMLRESFLSSLGADDETTALIRGTVFGDSHMLDEDITDDFRKNGTAHVLAVSGLHVGVLYSVYKAIEGKTGSKCLTVLFLIFLGFYCMLTLWSVSAVRASLLIAIKVIGNELDRRYDIQTALAAVLLGIVLACPWALFSASLIMSFLAVAGMSAVTGFAERHGQEVFAKVFAAQLAMGPYLMYTFSQLPLGAIFINIPVIFIISILVPLGMLDLGVFALGAGNGGVMFLALSRALTGMARILTITNSSASRVNFLAFTVPSPPLSVIVTIYLLIFITTSESFHIAFHRKNIGYVICCGILIAVSVAMTSAWSATPFDKASAIMVDVGQGDSMHFTSGKTDVLIDGGGKEDYDVGEKILMPYLLRNGRRDLDLACATHLHTDHYLGLRQLSGVYPVRKAVVTGKKGDIIKPAKDIKIKILWPVRQNPDAEDENVNSLIFKVYIKDYTVLVTGDISKEGEKMLLDMYEGTDELKSDVLKVPHHGSRFSSSPEFIRAVDPKIALIGVGKNNMYGHPAPEVIKRYEEMGIPVFRTDEDGAIGIRKEAGAFEVCTMK